VLADKLEGGRDSCSSDLDRVFEDMLRLALKEAEEAGQGPCSTAPNESDEGHQGEGLRKKVSSFLPKRTRVQEGAMELH
jgi:hypothetical protein